MVCGRLSGLSELTDLIEAVRAIPYRRITLDVTFPAEEPWDGRPAMPLACKDGDDFPAGPDPDADKRALEAEHCDAAVREPYIASLGR